MSALSTGLMRADGHIAWHELAKDHQKAAGIATPAEAEAIWWPSLDLVFKSGDSVGFNFQ